MLGYFGTLTFYKYLAIQKKRCFKGEEVLSVPVFQVLWNRLQTFKPGPLNMVKITNTDTFSYWKVSWVSWVLFNKEFEINVCLLHLSNPSCFIEEKNWTPDQDLVWSLWSPKTPLVGLHGSQDEIGFLLSLSIKIRLIFVVYEEILSAFVNTFAPSTGQSYICPVIWFMSKYLLKRHDFSWHSVLCKFSQC